ncbi:MAG: rane fusion protein multidrug efflux system [Burkholderiales bacterium]
MQKKILVAGALLVALLVSWYLFMPANRNADANKPAQAPAATVTTVSAKRMDVPVRLDAKGYVSSLNSVDIRPQVSNVIAKVHIKEGQFVKAGEMLFTLDDRAARVELQKAQAQIAKDKASLADLQRQLARSRELLSKGFIAQSAVDTVQAQVDAQNATLQSDGAAVEAARVLLSYQAIRAPSSGRAGVINVFTGSLVQPGMATPMVTISQLHPIAATFTVPEAELNAVLAAQKGAGLVKVAALVPAANARVDGGLSFVDNAVDPQNGTIRVKAVFPNENQLLWPGQYVALQTVVREIKDAIVIPQAAIIVGVDARTVYVVDANKSAQPKRIELVYSFGDQAVVKGLEPGELVIVDGKQNLRPGMKVRDTRAGAGNNDRAA